MFRFCVFFFRFVLSVLLLCVRLLYLFRRVRCLWFLCCLLVRSSDSSSSSSSYDVVSSSCDSSSSSSSCVFIRRLLRLLCVFRCVVVFRVVRMFLRRLFCVLLLLLRFRSMSIFSSSSRSSLGVPV